MNAAKLVAALRPAKDLASEHLREDLGKIEKLLAAADRYAAGLCATGSAIRSSDEASTMRTAAIDQFARTHLDGQESRADALAVIPEADVETDGDPEGVLFPIQAAYGDAGFYMGLAVGLRLAALAAPAADDAPRLRRQA
jgi:hypothetical protein